MEKRVSKGQGESLETSRAEELQPFIDCYSGMLYKIAFLQLRNSHDAEDVVQETFYQFVRTKKEFASADHEKAWLIKVTLNGCRKIWRCAWYRHTEPMPEMELSGDCNMEQEALKKEKAKEIAAAVLTLPRKYREVIHLFYFENLSVREICMATDRRESTVTSQLTRGRDILRKKLGEEYRYE